METCCVSPGDTRKMADYLFALKSADGDWRASTIEGYLGISDCLYNDTSAAAYVAELLLTLGVEHPNRKPTVDFINARQTPEGTFKPLDERCASRWYVAHSTWKSLRGLRALGGTPRHDPLPFLMMGVYYMRRLKKMFHVPSDVKRPRRPAEQEPA